MTLTLTPMRVTGARGRPAQEHTETASAEELRIPWCQTLSLAWAVGVFERHDDAIARRAFGQALVEKAEPVWGRTFAVDSCAVLAAIGVPLYMDQPERFEL